ncbi:hypothetical protein MF271_15205 [Deinococcus sp. KNUC1210]|uniref:hypothetical protein n=1 Tax=Deinococcus sp. KNUC1210 TaxID=2917691 RepID=UPI001EF0A7CF|nr:hypothetical protein [Deinococcus sp. KNUC1210]ULH15275.1 hypothetical protein MF271_15205 [Deinococcus sp. KNUC1210]
MSIFELLIPIFSQISGYIDSSPSKIQFSTQSLVSASYIISTASSLKKIKALEGAIKYNFDLLEMKCKQKVDYDYIYSEAFIANFVQAIRATEIAESERKIHFIAESLTGCTVKMPILDINRSQCMRIVEQITMEELDYLTSIMSDVRFSRNPDGFRDFGAFVLTDQNEAVILGLAQLSLLKLAGFSADHERRSMWRPTILGEHLILLQDQIKDES